MKKKIHMVAEPGGGSEECLGCIRCVEGFVTPEAKIQAKLKAAEALAEAADSHLKRDDVHTRYDLAVALKTWLDAGRGE